MALYDESRLTDSSQNVQGVNVGQFGPSYDSLQDWRSVFATAEEVRKIAEDIKNMRDAIEALDESASKILGEAQSAVTVATEINETTINTVQAGWADTARLHQEVVADKASVDASEQIVTTYLEDMLEEVAKASAYALESEKAMSTAEEVVDTLTNISATAHYAIGDTPTATYNPTTGELKIGIPAHLKAEATGVQSIWHNGGYAAGPEVKLTAKDVGAFAIDGSSEIEVPLDFKINNRRGFVAEAKTSSDKGRPEFRVLYKEEGNTKPRQGLIIDSLGNGAFGGELYVSNSVAVPSRVYHERFKPTITDLGAVQIGTVYSKEESDERYAVKGIDTSYTKKQIDTKLAAKVNPAPSDGKVYTWVGAKWTSIANTITDLQQKFVAIDNNTVTLVELSNKLDTEINKPVVYTKSMWKGEEARPSFSLLGGRTYTLVTNQGLSVPLLNSVTFTHGLLETDYQVVSGTGTVAITQAGDLASTGCKIKEIICHNYRKGDTYNGY